MAKNNEKIWRSFRIVLVIFGITASIVGVAIAYGVFCQKVSTHDLRLDKVETKTEKNRDDIAELKGDVKYIRIAVDRIERKID